MRYVYLLPILTLAGCALLPENGVRAKLLDMPALAQALSNNPQARSHRQRLAEGRMVASIRQC